MLDAEDHRHIAQRLDLLHFQEEAPGMVFWHPRGFVLYQALEGAARSLLRQDGYAEVRTPQVLRQAIWEASGHQAAFASGMLAVADGGPPSALKPVSCPGHAQLFKRAAPSWRDLPMRLAEFGVVHRNEPQGVLQGLLRLRQFTQDDGHIFCAPEQAVEEMARCCRSVARLYRAFGFERIRVGLSTRPAQRFGEEARWDQAEAMLAEAAQVAGLHEVLLQPGEGAFYGPKLEFGLEDRRGRWWQCGTLQCDFFMPERFDLRYVDAGNVRRPPLMLHRAFFGSLERFMGILLEHHAGRLPPWLAAEQARVLPVGLEHAAWAEEVAATLRDAGLRARCDARNHSLGRRVKEAFHDAVPFHLVVGSREVEARAVHLHGDDLALDAACQRLAAACASPL